VHVLTKIFIVLVSLLSVLLVPLVVVYAYNENNFKSRYQAAEEQKVAAQEAMKMSEARLGADNGRLQAEIDQLRTARGDLEKNRAADQAKIHTLESTAAASAGMQTEISSKLSLLAKSVEAGQQLTDSLVTELRQLRSDAVALEKQKVDLDEFSRDLQGQLEVAVAARRALEEELARVKEEQNKAVTKLGMYQARFGDIEVRAGALGRDEGIFPDKSLEARIVRVDRSTGQVLAEISTGSTSGVKQDWSMTIKSGGEFIANLRIINVDINRATGIVTRETKERPVQVGDVAYSIAGQR
jgi:chromosome segregation ATPase